MSDTKTCPYCAEEIKAAASICRYCGKEIEKEIQDDSLFISELPSNPSVQTIQKSLLSSGFVETASQFDCSLWKMLKIKEKYKLKLPYPSSENLIAGIASFVIPGLGQFLQGRVVTGIKHFAICVLLWIFFLGWIMNLFSAFEAVQWTENT